MTENQKTITIEIAPKMQEKICKLRYMKNMITYIVGVDGTSIPETWLANTLTNGNIYDLPAFCAAIDAMAFDNEIERDNGFVKIAGNVRAVDGEDHE
jgi:hypothetical protein